MTAPPAGDRFAFGANWKRFLPLVDERRVVEAERSLEARLGPGALRGRSFLDVGSGSGLFSLAARRLGASVRSFDLDPESVWCTAELRRRFRPDDPDWAVGQGSVLDRSFMAALGPFDIVYAWGVLHHTGALFEALDCVRLPLRPGGRLFVSVYNNVGWRTRVHTALKRAYVGSPRLVRAAILGGFAAWQLGTGLAVDVIRLRNPVARYRDRNRPRGMSTWRDWVDWVGGYPFETARPGEILHFYAQRGLTLTDLVTRGRGAGCNEFVFALEERGRTPAAVESRGGQWNLSSC